MPSNYNDRAEIREIEPYVYSQSTHSKYSPRYGASRLPWLTGAAAWAYYAATQYVLGIKPEYQGITIEPCIPQKWDKLTIKRIFRSKTLNIEIQNPDRKEKGVKKLVLNGEVISGNFIHIDKLKQENDIVAFL